MNIREFLLEKPQENNIISFLQDGANQSENQNTSEYLSNLKNEVINDFYKNKDKYAKEYEKYNFKDQNLTNPMGNISEYKRDLYDYNKNPSMNADDLSNYILDKQSKFNASKPIFTDNNEVARKNNQFMRDLGDELQKSGRGRLLQDDDGSYWVQDNNGNYSKVQGSTMGDLYRGIRDNGASVALGTAGAIGGTMLGGGVGMVAGGALGASLGAGYDYYGNTKDTNQDMNLKEALMLMGENAGLSLIGDTAFAGVVKGARALKNTYNMAKTGARAGKDMIDGMAVKGGNLKENIGDKLRKISPSILNDLASQGSETSRLYAKEIADSKGNGVYDELLKNANKIPLEVNQGNAIVDTIANKANYFKEMSKNKTINNILEKTEEGLRTFSKNIGSKEAILNQQNLLNMSLMDDDLAKMARDVLIAKPEVANKVGNTLANSDEALLKNLKLDNEFSAKNLYDLNNTRKLRAYEEYEKGLDKLDELNPNGIKIDKKNLNDLIQNADFFGQNIPKALKDFLKELNSDTPMSATKLNTRIKELSEEIKTNKSYDFNSFLENLKQNLLDSMVKNATNPQEAKEILTKIRSDYKAFKTYEKSNIADKLSGSEKDITKKLKQLIDETNPKKNYESISKGLNDKELIILDDEIIKRFIDKNKLEFNGKYIVNYPKLMKDIENFTPKSNSAKEKIQVLKSIYNLRSSFEHIIDGIFNTKAKEAGKGISTDFKARAMTMLVNSFTDHVAFIFLRFTEIGKRAGLRIQMRRAFANINTLQDFNKASKEFIESIKDKTLKEEAQEARKEFNSKVKDLIKGDNFFMDKADPSKAKSDYTAKFNVEKWINNVSGILKDEWVVNLKAMAKKHPEMFKNEADVFKVIKEIKDNPTHFFKNYDDEVALIAKPLKDDKVGNIAIKKDSGKIIHINKTKGKDLERLNRRNKAMLTGTPTPATTKGSTTNVEGDLLQHSFKNSTQTKPKTNLMDDIKENIKAKEVKKKNKKSVKQRLDEKIQNDKKASEERIKKIKQVIARKQKIDKVTDKKNSRKNRHSYAKKSY
ncbi:TPA: hypothetical protein IEE34_001069 [Campylobacter coli]|nr:hypothetical protein [Campylobacter coli]